MKLRRRKAKAAALPHFEPAIKRNWGYWEGVAAREANRIPEWAKGHVAPWAAPHFDEAYKAGFLVGWEGEAAPNWHPCPFEGK